MAMESTAAFSKKASIEMTALTTEQKNQALACIRDALKANAARILKENQADLEQAKRDNLSEPLLKRLKFDQGKLDEVCEGINSLIALPDPVRRTLSATELDRGLELYKVTCPIGVIGVSLNPVPMRWCRFPPSVSKAATPSFSKAAQRQREPITFG